jgi:hypothetical protein
MINAILESTMRSAIELDENKNEDGSINWNFVDADAYMDVHNLYRSNNDFYEAFNDIADKIESENAVESKEQLELDLLQKYPNAEEQLEVLKKDYLGQ